MPNLLDPLIERKIGPPRAQDWTPQSRARGILPSILKIFKKIERKIDPPNLALNKNRAQDWGGQSCARGIQKKIFRLSTPTVKNGNGLIM